MKKTKGTGNLSPCPSIDGQIQDFLAEYNLELLELIDEVDSASLAKNYFNQDDFGLIARKFKIVTAKNNGVK